MTRLLELFPLLLAQMTPPMPGATKCLSEMAIALSCLKQSYPADLLDPAGIAAVEAALFERLHSDAYLSLVSNGFLLQQCATPYILLRSPDRRSAFYEGVIGDLLETDRTVREATPYRRMERGYFLYKLGAGPLQDWAGVPVLADARQAHAFDRDLAYAFTHMVFFSTDFCDVPRHDPFVKGVAMLLAAQAEAANDLDLFMECCLCLTTQRLEPVELAGMLHLIEACTRRNAVLFEARNLAAEYHPLFVHGILRGRVLQHFGHDITTLPPGAGAGPFGDLAVVARALGGKDAAAIDGALAEYQAKWGVQIWLQDMVCTRLMALHSLARHAVLFEREFLALGARSDPAYEAYVATVSGLLAGLGQAILNTDCAPIAFASLPRVSMSAGQ